MERIDNDTLSNETILTKKDLKRSFKHIGGAIFFNLTLQILIAMIATVSFLGFVVSLSSAYHFTINAEEIIMFIMLVTLLAADTFPFFLCARRLKIKIRDFLQKPELQVKEFINWFFAIMAIVVAFNVVSSILISFLPFLQVESAATESKTLIGIILNVLTIAIVAPIFEEIAFRGIILHTFKQYGTRFAILASSMLFGLLHGNITQSLFAFILGILLSKLTLKAKSILPAIFIHVFNNAMALITVEWMLLTIFAFLFIVGVWVLIKNRTLFKKDYPIPDHRFCWDALLSTPSVLAVVAIYILFIIGTTLLMLFPTLGI